MHVTMIILIALNYAVLQSHEVVPVNLEVSVRVNDVLLPVLLLINDP
jgi:hypothetical protein